jgi:hypothetical protein
MAESRRISGSDIKVGLRYAGWTQRQLAAALNLLPQQLSMLLNYIPLNSSKLRDERLERAAKVLEETGLVRFPPSGGVESVCPVRRAEAECARVGL